MVDFGLLSALVKRLALCMARPAPTSCVPLVIVLIFKQAVRFSFVPCGFYVEQNTS